MTETVLMKLKGSAVMSNTWAQELTITDSGVRGYVNKGIKRIHMSVPYDGIAQVNLVSGIFKSDLELVNKGGTDNLVIKALPKKQALEAKGLIEKKMQEFAVRQRETIGRDSIADELRKLADLKSQGVLSQEEFDAQKKHILRQ